MPPNVEALVANIKYGGWDVTQELIAMVWDQEMSEKLQQVAKDFPNSTQEHHEQRKEKFANIITNPHAKFTLSIISGGHRHAALTQAEADGDSVVPLPTHVNVRVTSHLDPIIFNYMSRKCNDLNELHAKQLVIDKLNQMATFIECRRALEGAEKTQAHLQQVYFQMYGSGKGSTGWFSLYYNAVHSISESNRRLIEERCKVVGGEILTQKSVDFLRKVPTLEAVSFGVWKIYYNPCKMCNVSVMH